MGSPIKAAIYARVSTLDQEPENQLSELRCYADARGWMPTEYVDHGVSGAKERRPALDRLLADARRRRFDVLVCWRLDRLGRNLRHLVTLLDELAALGSRSSRSARASTAPRPRGGCSSTCWPRWLSLKGLGASSASRRASSEPERRESASAGRWLPSLRTASLRSPGCPSPSAPRPSACRRRR